MSRIAFLLHKANQALKFHHVISGRKPEYPLTPEYSPYGTVDIGSFRRDLMLIIVEGDFRFFDYKYVFDGVCSSCIGPTIHVFT